MKHRQLCPHFFCDSTYAFIAVDGGAPQRHAETHGTVPRTSAMRIHDASGVSDVN